MTSYAYILECADGTLYSGWTNDLDKRLAAHNAKKGAKYTRSRLPVVLRYYETFPDKIAAQQRAWQFKQLTRAQKLKLIAEKEKKAKQEGA